MPSSGIAPCWNLKHHRSVIWWPQESCSSALDLELGWGKTVHGNRMFLWPFLGIGAAVPVVIWLIGQPHSTFIDSSQLSWEWLHGGPWQDLGPVSRVWLEEQRPCYPDLWEHGRYETTATFLLLLLKIKVFWSCPDQTCITPICWAHKGSEIGGTFNCWSITQITIQAQVNSWFKPKGWFSSTLMKSLDLTPSLQIYDREKPSLLHLKDLNWRNCLHSHRKTSTKGENMKVVPVLLRCVHAGCWGHRRWDLPHLHRDCIQTTQRCSQETDAAGLRCRERVEEEPAGTPGFCCCFILLLFSGR